MTGLMQLTFHKMHGLGNDFVLLDCLQEAFSLTAEQIRFVADRRFGVGCDQVLVIEHSVTPGVAASYRIFNQDGSAAEHCGNGVRCVAKYLNERLDGNPEKIKVEIASHPYELLIEDSGAVRVDMGSPIFEPARIPSMFPRRQTAYDLTVGDDTFSVGAVSMGNPHVVFPVDKPQKFPVEEIGQALQEHECFPKQVNAGFMNIERRDSISLRVWERGAGETLACGTGACAAVVVGRLWERLDDSVEVHLTGGNLRIEWSGNENDSVWMTGEATYVFEGKISI
ncbi:MAG: diaminopimelate epimerase [Pseudomonadota bacterium]